jgi:hypothetical protein
MDELAIKVRHPATGVLHTMAVPAGARAGEAAGLVALELGLVPEGGDVSDYWLADEVDGAVLQPGVPLRLVPSSHPLQLGGGPGAATAPPRPQQWEPARPGARPDPFAPSRAASAPRPPRPATYREVLPFGERISVSIVVVMAGALLTFIAFFAVDGVSASSGSVSVSLSVDDYVSRANDAADAGGGDNLRWTTAWYGIPAAAGLIGLVAVGALLWGRPSRAVYGLAALLAILAVALNFLGWTAAATDEDGGAAYMAVPLRGFWELENVTYPAFPVMLIGCVVVLVGGFAGMSRSPAGSGR